MAKAYWITFYREVRDPEKLAAYAKLASPATAPFGAKISPPRHCGRGLRVRHHAARRRHRIRKPGKGQRRA